MADNPSLQVEARLKDFMTQQLKTLEENLRAFSEKGKKDFAVVEKASEDVQKAVVNTGKGFDGAKKKAESFGVTSASIFAGAKDSLVNFAKQFGPAAIATGLLTKGVMELRKEMEFIKVSAEGFQHSMTRVRAIIEPTSNGFLALQEQAKMLGESTVFTAGQVADSFVAMGQLGLKTNDIVAASAAVVNLAAIAETNMQQAGSAVVETMNQFNISANDSGRIVDVMAKVFTSSAIDMNTFTESMKYVGPIARGVGVSLEQTSASLAVLADQGLKGSQAGTGLRFTLSELYQSTSKAGKAIGVTAHDTRTLYERLEALSAKGYTTGQVMDMFGERAGSVASILIKNVDATRKMEDRLLGASGAAKRMANTMLDDVAGAAKIAESAHEGFAIAFGSAFGASKEDRLKFIATLYNDMTQMVMSHQEVLVGLGETITTVFKVVASIGLGVGKTVTGVIDTVATVLAAASTGITAFAETVAKTINWVSQTTLHKDAIGAETMQELADMSSTWANITVKNAQNVAAAFVGTKYAIEDSGAGLDAVGGGRKIVEDVVPTGVPDASGVSTQYAELMAASDSYFAYLKDNEAMALYEYQSSQTAQIIAKRETEAMALEIDTAEQDRMAQRIAMSDYVTTELANNELELALLNDSIRRKALADEMKAQQVKVAIWQSSSTAIVNVLSMLGKKNKALAVAGKIVATGQAAINAYLAATSAAAQAPIFLKTATFASQLALGLSGAAAIAATPLARGSDNFPGGMALVGERGPELIQLPQGSRVTPAEQTRRIMNQSSTTFVLNIAPGATVDRVAARSINSRLEEMNDLLRMGQSNGMIRLNEILARGA